MRLYLLLALSGAVAFLAGCESPRQKEEHLARRYCSSCHMFPDPSLLDRKTWDQHVLPQMAFRMGLPDMNMLMRMSEADRTIILSSLPGKPMVTVEEWESIKRYYANMAPDSLLPTSPLAAEGLTLFDTLAVRLPGSALPTITVVKADTANHRVFAGNRMSSLYQFNTSLELEDSFMLPSPPSNILTERNTDPTITCMGIMDPNEQSRGEILSLSLTKHTGTQQIASLQRPVYLEKADLNDDGREDYIVCEFGNYTGMLSVFEQDANGKFKKHIIQALPGARRVVIKDVDGNKLPDILCLMTQGDEKLVLLHNHGDFKFRLTTLLRFPPIYGSSYFDVADFNHDGKFDLLVAQGDNLDYSIVLKPYHGIRLYLNDGNNAFSEKTFLPMDGASQATAADFDGDGDIDIAAIAFFADFNKNPQKGFLYFENMGGNFIAHETPAAADGRWITMDVADVDADGDPDILLGSINFNNGVPDALFNKWTRRPVSVLYLKNRLYRPDSIDQRAGNKSMSSL